MNHVGNILGYRLARELKLVSNESYQRELAVCIERPTKYWSLPPPHAYQSVRVDGGSPAQVLIAG